jgi:hypothetical protein
LFAYRRASSSLLVNLPNYNPDSYDISLIHNTQGLVPQILYVEIVLNSDGTGNYNYFDNTFGLASFTSFTWLLAGSASSCWAFMDTPVSLVGPIVTFNDGSSDVNSSIQLNTNRYWRLRINQSYPGPQESSAISSTLRIQDGQNGADLVAKTLTMSVTTEAGS